VGCEKMCGGHIAQRRTRLSARSAST
jgi:hypothetical protein